MNGIELLLERLTGAGEAVWRASWQASVLAALVLAVQLVFGRRIAPRWRHAMWVLVLVRLALPVVPSSRLSVFNLAPLRDDQPVWAGSVPVAGEPQPLLSTTAFAEEMRARAERFSPDTAAPTPAPAPAPVYADAPPPSLWKGWPQALAAAWAAGVLLLAARVAWATWRVSRAMRRLDRVTDDGVLDVLRATAGELRVRHLPALLTGDDLFSPALVGFVRPRLLLPRDLLARFDAAELRLVLLHELAHLKRRDVLVNWFATLLTVLHWPNPVAWLVAWRLRLERELATDELVMSRTTTDADRRAYGHTIVKLLETFARGSSAAPVRPVVPAGGVGILEGKQQMKRRITMIAGFARRNRAWTVVAASLVLGLGVVALTDAAQQPAPANNPAASQTDGGSAVPDPAGAMSAAPQSDRSTLIYRLDRLTDELGRLKKRRGERAGTLGEKSPELIAIDREIAEMERQIREMQAAANALKLREETRAAEELRSAIRPDELVTVSIMDLAGPGIETVKTSRPDREGNISLPYVGKIKAAGTSSADLEQAVAKAYGEKKLIQNALVAVSLPGRGESHQLSNKARPAGGEQAGMMDPAAFAGMMGEAGMEPGRAPVDPAMAALLDRKIPEVTFDGVAFTDVVDFLRDVTSANIFVDWRTLEAAGVDRNAPVTARLRDVAFKDALAIVLRGVDHSLNFNVRNGVIHIAAAVKEKPVELAVTAYDVGDLVAAAFDVKGGAEALANVISETVRPEFWRKSHANGQGTISAFGNKVVVTATPEVHREVEALLTVLRDPAAAPPSPPTTKPAPKAEAPIRVDDMTAEDIALVDQQMNQHLQMKQEIELRIEQLKQSGAGENSPALKPATDLLKIRNKLIEDRAEWFREKNKGLHFPDERHRIRERQQARSR